MRVQLVMDAAKPHALTSVGSTYVRGWRCGISAATYAMTAIAATLKLNACGSILSTVSAAE